MTEPSVPAPPASAPPAATIPSEPSSLVGAELSAPPVGDEVALVPEPEAPAPIAAPAALAPARRRPSFVFFGLVSAIALLLDISTKAWAEIRLIPKPFE